MGKFEKLKVNKNITYKDLEAIGFKRGVYKKHIYKDLIDFVLGVNLQNGEWYYQVLDNNTGTMYIPYYNRIYGKNIVVEKLDKEVEKIFSKMRRNKIFYIKKKGSKDEK